MKVVATMVRLGPNLKVPKKGKILNRHSETDNLFTKCYIKQKNTDFMIMTYQL